MDKIFNNAATRLLYFIEDKGLSIRKFSESVGISHSLLKKTTAIGSDKLENILSVYPEINPEWLLTGKGEMLKLSGIGPGEGNAGREKKHRLIPLVDPAGIAGFWQSNSYIGEPDVKDYYLIPRFGSYHVDFMVEMAGVSMYPRYASGDLLACNMIREKSFIQWGRTYVIHTKKQGALVKRLYPGEGDGRDCIVCHSENAEYPPFEIHWREIDGLALVVGAVKLE